MVENGQRGEEIASIPDWKIRELFHDAVGGDLLGPADGPEEEILESSVRDRYLVGKLAPPNILLGAEEMDEMSSEADTSSDDGNSDENRTTVESLLPSSVGMTFCVSAECQEIEIHSTWGHYTRTDSEIHLTEAGRGRRVWRRTPAGGTLTTSHTKNAVKPTLPENLAQFMLINNKRFFYWLKLRHVSPTNEMAQCKKTHCVTNTAILQP